MKGAKGKACVPYAEFLKQIVGKVVSQEFTSEYYEPESEVKVKPLLRQEGSS